MLHLRFLRLSRLGVGPTCPLKFAGSRRSRLHAAVSGPRLASSIFLALLEARPEIGLMFIDVRMPGMTGPELAEAVRRRRPEIKLVLTSGSVGEEAVPGGMDFVPKPWRVDQVARVVGLSGSGAPAS